MRPPSLLQCCALCAVLALFSPQALSQPQPPPVIARSAILLDCFSGSVLYDKASRGRFYPASTTKILTALLIIEQGSLDREVLIDPSDTRVEPSIIGLKAGERVTRRALLQAMMMKSANDASIALARDNAGSVAAFARRMNRRAASLGAMSSNFVNPHGLHDPAHYSTAYDLALITRAALDRPLFRVLVTEPRIEWTGRQGGEPVALRNRNRLLLTFEGCTGVKTGYTRAAGQVLVSSALRNGTELISVVLQTSNQGIWSDSEALLAYGFRRFGGKQTGGGHAAVKGPRIND